MDFRSKVVVITGGGGGIGSAAGKLFCEAGAAVALVDLDASAAKDAAARIRDEVPSANVEPFAADLAIEDEAGRVVDEIASTLARSMC
jgi:2-hydroxycyclohexanecarboxyl-CoA dehydrogenase